jgi:hypothetical protein
MTPVYLPLPRRASRGLRIRLRIFGHRSGLPCSDLWCAWGAVRRGVLARAGTRQRAPRGGCRNWRAVRQLRRQNPADRWWFEHGGIYGAGGFNLTPSGYKYAWISAQNGWSAVGREDTGNSQFTSESMK